MTKLSELTLGICPFCKKEVEVEYCADWDQSLPLEEHYIVKLHASAEPGKELFCFGKGQHPVEHSLKP